MYIIYWYYNVIRKKDEIFVEKGGGGHPYPMVTGPSSPLASLGACESKASSALSIGLNYEESKKTILRHRQHKNSGHFLPLL